MRKPTRQQDEREGDDTGTLITRLRGRAKYLRKLGRVKSPQLMEDAAIALEKNLG